MQPSGVFDTLTSSIRSNVVRGAQSLVNNWNDCTYIIDYTRYTSYVVTLLLVFIVVTLIMKWNHLVLLSLTVLALLFSSFQAYLVSQRACFKIFQPAAL